MRQNLSKLLVVFTLCVINCSSLFAQNTITIVNEKAGKFQKTVESKWKKEKKTIIPMSDVTHLCVEGIFDSNIDTKYLFQAFPNLEFLNLDKLNGASISLNGALKLKELWAPSGCKYIATHEMPALQRLQIYCGTDLAEKAIIPIVYLKTTDDIGDPDFSSPFSESLIQSLINTEDQNVGLLITSPNIPDNHNVYHVKETTVPYFGYNKKNNGITLFRWEPNFTQDVLDYVTLLNDRQKGLLSGLEMEDVTLKEGVISIPKYCFTKNTSIKKVNLPNSVTSIGEFAFASSTIEYINIPHSVSVVPKSCFVGCMNLKDIEIPESVIEIQDNAFYGTSFIKTTIPESIKTIGNRAFGLVKHIYIKGRPQFSTLSFEFIGVESITLDSYIPPTVQIINSNWEEKTKNIIVSIPEGSYEVYSKDSFWGKLNLVERGEKISVNITSTKPGDFLTQLPPISDLPKIDSLTVAGFIYNTDLKIVRKCKSLKYIDFSQAFIMESPQSIQESKKQDEELQAIFGLIGMAADAKYKDGKLSTSDYQTASSITNIIVAASEITEASDECYVPSGAFSGMSYLEHIKLPLRAKSIGSSALKGCKNVKIVEMPLYVEKIGEAAFSGCKSLTEIKMPSSLNTLEENVFSSCSSLENIDLRGCMLKNKIRGREGQLSLSAFLGYSGNVYLPERITYVSVYMGDYYGTTKFHFPKSLSMIGCSFISDLTLYFYSKTPPALQSGMDRRKITNCIIYVPKGYTMTYYSAYGDSNKYIEME